MTLIGLYDGENVIRDLVSILGKYPTFGSSSI